MISTCMARLNPPRRNVHQAFDIALGESLDMQSDIYAEMSERGWYQNQQADAQQIAQVRQKFWMN